jgi:hypothetical protein
VTTATASLEPVVTGPTWQREGTGWLLPTRTLGWEVLGWTAEYLRQPDGPNAGERWNYTDEQVRFLLWWYALDEAGRFVYRYGMLRRVKGWGKDPIGATLCATEFVGPCRFGGWNADGEPIAIRHPAPWVLTAAVSKDQTRNTMTLFPSLFSDDAIKDFKIDLGKEIIYAESGRRRLEAVTSSARALEGARATFTLKNETQHWLANNEGHAMAEVIARNSTKSRDGAARVLAISNAHNPGEDSDAERDYEASEAIKTGKSRAVGYLYDSLEAPPDVDIYDEEQLRAGLTVARGDSEWLDIDRHVEEVYDSRNSVSTSRRFYLNQIIAAEDAWIAPHEYDALIEPQEVEDGTDITLGLDPSKSEDHTVLRACRVDDGYTFTLGAWDPAKHGNEVPRDELDAAVRQAHDRFNVLAFFSDLHPLESYVDQWATEFGDSYLIRPTPKHPIAWDMRTRVKETTIEYERLHDEVVEGAFKDDGHPLVKQHFHNARRRPNRWGVAVGKEHRQSARKMDAVPSTTLARTARRLVLDSGKRRRKRSGRAVFV